MKKVYLLKQWIYDDDIETNNLLGIFENKNEAEKAKNELELNNIHSNIVYIVIECVLYNNYKDCLEDLI